MLCFYFLIPEAPHFPVYNVLDLIKLMPDAATRPGSDGDSETGSDISEINNRHMTSALSTDFLHWQEMNESVNTPI